MQAEFPMHLAAMQAERELMALPGGKAGKKKRKQLTQQIQALGMTPQYLAEEVTVQSTAKCTCVYVSSAIG